ncbi:mevalonate kinase family protein [Thiomicrorhabdus heinhorstiae]|uniref:mevalonate kinase n=1 Tax=Thiomicrorhabdus heinhorstiae TaxID=2748010 RepID=A0ABS0BZF5_9GAMM|nr:hypothetical protein [Thiomicrorhabdus heinhorstiae]MBF6058415.1 hypothetical protein [Thiomicrorhabdus heinhorstiae]
MDSLCSAPAKLILSGEHAVLYGCPAISMAIPIYSHCRCRHTASSELVIDLNLKNLQHRSRFNPFQWTARVAEIHKRYRDFTTDQCRIDQVLQEPEELFLVAFEHFQLRYPLKNGIWHFELDSDIPIGRGLGSSASIIASMLMSLARQNSIELDPEALLEMTQNIEHFQHGRSSGIDPATIIHGGILRFQNEVTESLTDCELRGWIIDSGAPLSSTGECVAQVARNFSSDLAIWQKFTTVETELHQACLQSDFESLKTAVAHNQQLLEQIGVVPQKMTQFIHTLTTQLGGAAKICGAGSVTDGPGGILLYIGEQDPTSLCRKNNMPCYPLQHAHAQLICEDIPT